MIIQFIYTEHTYVNSKKKKNKYTCVTIVTPCGMPHKYNELQK